jgi:phosphomannomutase
MDFKIFKAYDIRGIYPSEINEEVVYAIAKGYVCIFKPLDVVIGMDVRISSPSLKESLIKGFLDSGVNVIDIGEITTDMLYFAVGNYNYSGGIIVSASHNPGEYNGLKMVKEKATSISSDTGLFDIREAIKNGHDKKFSSQKRGTYERKEILNDYIEHVLSFIDKSSIRELAFVGNANFGFVCKPIKTIVDQLHLNLIPLNFIPDGSFPKGAPDPMLTTNRAETEELIRKSNADFGVAWDADADRAMFFDEEGRFISGAYITAFLSKIMLEKYGKNNKIILDPRVIWPTLKVVNEIGGHSLISKCGHTFMKDRMRSEDALFAGEMSAHYYFRDNFYADNGVIPFLLILEYISKKNKRFSEIIAPFMDGHYMSGELNYKIKNINLVIEKVRSRFGCEGKEDFTDGYSVESDEWRFNIRPSNTEPLLRLNVEAKNVTLVNNILKEIKEIINGQ